MLRRGVARGQLRADLPEKWYMPHKRKDLNIKGANLWYFVGLITSDGNLSPDGRHIDITSKNHAFLRGVKKTVGISNKIGTKYGSQKRHKAYRLQIANRNFYDFLRGVIDGDGNMRQWIHPSNKREQWSLRIYSGSKEFMKWLDSTIERLMGVRGRIYKNNKSVWALKYGKMAARVLAHECYYQGCFALRRKKMLARECIKSPGGWCRSKTIDL